MSRLFSLWFYMSILEPTSLAHISFACIDILYLNALFFLTVYTSDMLFMAIHRHAGYIGMRELAGCYRIHRHSLGYVPIVVVCTLLY